MPAASSPLPDGAAVGPRDDFPEFFNPITVKEWRQALRSWHFVTTFVVTHVAAVAATVIELSEGFAGNGGAQSLTQRLDSIFGGSPFWIVAQCALVVFFPLGAFGALQSETRGGQGELLVMAALSRKRIVAGKFFAHAGIALLVWLSLLPYLCVRYFGGGGVELVREAFTAGYVLVANATATAVVLGASGYSSFLMRIWMAAYQGGSLFVTAAAVFVGSAVAFDKVTGGAAGGDAWIVGLAVACMLTVAALHIAFGLGLARARLRPASVPPPADPAELGELPILLFVVPFGIVLAALMTSGFGALPAALFFLMVVHAATTPPPRHPTARPAR